MDSPRISDLQDLAERKGGRCLSLYLPMHQVGDNREDEIRLEHMLQHAEDSLVQGRWRRPAARDFLNAARQSLQSPDFWRYRGAGTAMFVAPEFLRTFHLVDAVDESLVIAERMHIKPLLPLVDRGEWFYLLTLSQNHVRLLKISRDSAEEIRTASLPSNMRSELDYTSVDRGEQVHSAARGDLGKQSAVFHGQGGQPDTLKSDLAEFFRAVDRSLAPVLRDQSSPLLLGGVNYLLPIFRQVCSHSNLSEHDLTGNFDHMSDSELSQRGWNIMRDWFDRPRRDRLAQFANLIGTGRASADVVEIVSAASIGKVETLFADCRATVMGRYDAQTGKAAIETDPANTEDLINLAVCEVVLKRGTVFHSESASAPCRSPLAAIYRY